MAQCLDGWIRCADTQNPVNRTIRAIPEQVNEVAMSSAAGALRWEDQIRLELTA
ncbi:MAG TPA: hypothetical protein PLP42_03585 [Acidobacteriota bacterium]|nr:hypothetical protein [Acidobacteriota bacterium]